MTHHTNRRLIDVRDVAEKLGRSVSSVWNDVRSGSLPGPVRRNGSTRWDEREIDAWLDRLLAEREGEAA